MNVRQLFFERIDGLMVRPTGLLDDSSVGLELTIL